MLELVPDKYFKGKLLNFTWFSSPENVMNNLSCRQKHSTAVNSVKHIVLLVHFKFECQEEKLSQFILNSSAYASLAV